MHRLDNKVLFEIADTLMGRDMLWLTRLAAAPQDLSAFTNAGTNLNEQLVRWERQGERVLLRSVSSRYIADTTLADRPVGGGQHVLADPAGIPGCVGACRGPDAW